MVATTGDAKLSSRAGARAAPWALLSPGALWLILFFIVPIASLARMSLSSKKSRFDFRASFTWQWSNFSDALRAYGGHFVRSFAYAGLATVFALLVGFPLAYVIAFRGGRWKSVLLGLVALPFFTSFLLRTLAWKTLLADDGVLLSAVKGVGLRGPLQAIGIMQDGRVLASPTAVVGGLTYNFLPFMIMPIYVALERIDHRLMDAANDLYANNIAAFRRIIMPLALPGVFAGSLLTFIPASGDFVNDQFLGDANRKMIGTVVQERFIRNLDYPSAAALSFILMTLITVAVLVYARVLGTEDLTG